MNSVKLRAAGGPLGVVHEAPGRVPEDLGPILYRQLQREHVLLPIIIHILEPLTIIHTYIPHTLYPGQGLLRHSSEMPTFYQNYLAMRNTADVTGGKPITV
jgi:hypothetical protein